MPHRSAIAVADIQQSAPNHADTGMMVHMQKGKLLTFLPARNDEEGIKVVKVLGNVVNKDKILKTVCVLRIDAKQVGALREPRQNSQSPYHVNV